MKLDIITALFLFNSWKASQLPPYHNCSSIQLHFWSSPAARRICRVTSQF